MAQLKQRAEGFYSADMKPGTPVFDNPDGTGNPLPEVEFEAYGKTYTTDGDGKLIEIVAAAAGAAIQAAHNALNPLEPGVTYEDFCNCLPDTKPETIKNHLLHKVVDFISDHVIDWIVDEVQDFLKKKKK